MRGLLGALLWSLFLLFAVLLHGIEEKRRLAEYEGLCRLLSHLRGALLSSPSPLPEIYARFSDDALLRAGFLDILREKGLADALAAKKLSLDDEDLIPFLDYAEKLGGRLYGEELRETEILLSLVTETAAKKAAALPERRRLTGTVFFSGGMLILLLFL